MTFLVLAIVLIAAFLGPLLALRESWHVPVLIGELVAGIILGSSGFHVVNAKDPTFTFIATVGFALVMFVAGSHVPVRDAKVRTAVTSGALRFVIVAAVSIAIGIAAAVVFHTSNAPLYAVLLSSSSAALVLPIIDSLSLKGTPVLRMTAQVAIADVACIVALPLVIDPARAGRALVGVLAVVVCAIALFFVLRAGDRSGLRKRVHRVSEDRKFALELRIDLSILFGLAAIAVFFNISVMLAGFAFGLVVAGVGEPRRLTRQIFGLMEGFLGPVFFVWLGASLNLSGLIQNPAFIALGATLGLGALLTHALTRFAGQPLSLGLLSAAQLGVPVAAVAVGTQLKVLSDGEAAAIILGALITIVVSTIAGGLASRRDRRTAAAAGPAAGPTAGSAASSQ
jgi:Kef-type K+ transport system membrane component KefB